VGGFSIDSSSVYMTNRVLAWVRICRPLIIIISVFGSSVGALNVTIADITINAGFHLEWDMFLLTMLAAAFLAGGLMVHNDFTDLESDRVNRPQKPIPSGLIKPKTAAITGIIMMVISVLISFSTTLFANNSYEGSLTPYGINLPCGLLTSVIAISGIYYNSKGKYRGIIGHLIVAFGVGAIPLWGAWAMRPYSWNDLKILLPLASAIFLMEIGREIMVCIGDLKGDIAAGFKTTPVRQGRMPSMYLVILFYSFFIPLYPISYYGLFGFPEIYGKLYLAGATVFLLILYLTWIKVWITIKKEDDEIIWNAFELNIRTGTRMGVLLFQIILFAEAFI